MASLDLRNSCNWTLSTALTLAMSAVLTAGGATAATAANKSSFNVLYTFTGGNSGGSPGGNLLADKAGNLYGTTSAGGTGGQGIVFKLAPNGTETVLYSFTGGNDGGLPLAGLVQDKEGNFYGTTYSDGGSGYGVVFKLAPDGTETVLHSFAGGKDGEHPYAGLILGKKGYLYGTTYQGGTSNLGTVFRVRTDGKTDVLHMFAGGSNDGSLPQSGLIEDKAGNLYGTTTQGGTGGTGTVFELAQDGTFTILHSFADANGVDGSTPVGGLVMDETGNLYGTTVYGGPYSWGTVFEVTPDGTESILYSFENNGDGNTPENTLFLDRKGDLYGTTGGGGTGGQGVVFELAPGGTLSVLHSFTGGADGGYPFAGLIRDAATGSAYLYGSDAYSDANGYNGGVVFEIRK